MDSTKTGILEVTDKGYGFLRDLQSNFEAGSDDVYISAKLIQDNYLREGCIVTGAVGEAKQNAQTPPLASIDSVNDMEPAGFKDIWEITDKVPLNPNEQFKIETGSDDFIGRAIDIFSPIGKGQRGLIVAPPKAGKTTIIKHIAKSIALNHPDTKLFAVLIDERPEEVTDFKRSTGATVYSSNLDERPEKHMRIAKLAFSVAQIQAEMGHDVVVLIDSLTRMTRAFNLRNHGRGKTLSGGIDAEALAMPKRFFGQARNFEGKGSLTVLASILVETGSKMDEVIFQEYKGTGNMELVLDRTIAERGIYPAISILESGTRKEELILGKDIKATTTIRRKLSEHRDIEALAEILGAFRKTKSNSELFSRITGTPVKK